MFSTFFPSLKKMIESGVINNIWSKYKVKPPEVKSYYKSLNLLLALKNCLGTGIDALALENVIGIFILLAGALGAALVIFVVECLIK